jgi:hypothetical protein
MSESWVVIFRPHARAAAAADRAATWPLVRLLIVKLLVIMLLTIMRLLLVKLILKRLLLVQLPGRSCSC